MLSKCVLYFHMLVFALKPLMAGSFSELFHRTHAMYVCVCVLVKEGWGGG